MSTIHNLTIEARLDEQSCGNLISFFKEWRTEYGRMLRYVWHHYATHASRPGQAAFNIHLQRHFGITKRTANSLIFDAVGRYNALIELKKTEKALLETKIATFKDTIESFKKDVDTAAEVP